MMAVAYSETSFILVSSIYVDFRFLVPWVAITVNMESRLGKLAIPS